MDGSEKNKSENNSSVEFGVKNTPKDKKALRSQVLSIAMPALVELSLVQLCTMVDTMMVSRLGAWATSAVGYCAQPRFILLAVFIALNTGATALIARSKGEGDREQANSVLQQSVMMSFCLAIVVSVIGFFTSRYMILFMGAKDEQIISGATAYMKIQMAGFVFNALTMSVTACLRGIGKTKVSMIYDIISNLINVVFNYLFIYGRFGFPRWEVAGASLATVIGQVIAFLFAAAVVLKFDDYLRLEIKKFFQIKISIIRRIVRIGLPAMGEQLIMRIGMVVYLLTITALGTDAFATHHIASNILSMTFMTGQAFGVSATSLMGQNLGAKDIDGAKECTHICRRFGMVCSIFLVTIFVLFGRQVAMLYTDDEAIIAEVAKILLVVAFMQPLQTSQLIISGALRGAGDTMVVAIFTFIGVLLIRPLLSLFSINVLHMGLLGAWIAMILDQIFRSLVSFIRFKSGKWVYIRV